MNGGIADDPLARSLLRQLAAERGADDPLGSFARTVLDGEMSLREAADNPWHAQALAAAMQRARTALDHMSPQERAEIQQAARQLAGRTPEEDPGPEEDREPDGDQR
jgi:tRNA-dihydrouridine synthase